jgi:uncharacterized RDD family membrane protein YckC
MDNSYANPYHDNDLLTEFEVNLVQASSGKRFANFIIDLVVVVVITVLLLGIYMFATGSLLETASEGSFAALVENVVYSVIFGVLYGLIEGIFKGKSLGKLITGTRAVNADGTRISFKSAILRGLSRIVPFEAFSALGTPSYPWHDRWTNTLVVDEKESSLPRNA